MFVSHSRVLLRFRYLLIEQGKKLPQNASNRSNFLRYSSGAKFENEVSNSFKEHNVAEQLLNKIGYSARLESNMFKKVDTNVQKCTYFTNKDNLKQSKDKQFLEEYDYNDDLTDINLELPQALDPCTEDLSHIGPNLEPTYNFAKYADQSNTIQQFVKLGVELYKLEKDLEIVKLFLCLDFDKDVAPYLQFLHNCGLEAKHFGYFITRYPTIFQEDMDDLMTRIRYLRAHNFTPDMIKDIMYKYPPFLSVETQELDNRLGYFQSTFSLNGNQMRKLTRASPKLVTYHMKYIQRSTFALKEEMGFNEHELKHLLLTAPRAWIRAKSEVLRTFDYLHNIINFSHRIISKQGQALLCRRMRLESRHKFLVELKRNQHDPTKPLYVSPLMLVLGDDVTFCENVAKCNVSTYNMFLKTM